MSSIPPTYYTYHQSAVIVVTAMSGTLLLCILVFLSLFSDNQSAVLVLALVFGTVLLFNFVFAVFALSDTICRFLGCQHGNDLLDNDDETYYELLSPEKRLELDNLRSRAILRHLNRFTLSLKKENMLKPADFESSSSMDDDSAGQEESGKQNNVDDFEMDVVAPDNSEDVKTQCDDDKDDAECTHVLIPHPGQASDDRHVTGIDNCCTVNETKMKLSSLSRKKLFHTSKVGQDIKHEEMENPKEGTLVSELRAVPIFCAVCLMKYEISDRVCWSSNSECSHMFHEDCMLRWQMVLGRKHSRRKRFSANPSEKKLLDFALTCPCCRQDFILSNLIIGTDENV